MSSIVVGKVLNNNVIIAQHPDQGEVVVIGKGIGFNRKAGESIPSHSVEKMFFLKNIQEQEQYKQLLPQVDEQLIEVINEVILYISSKIDQKLNEHIHIALTDHIAFAIKRLEQNIVIHNPFLFETKEIYPLEYDLAQYAIKLIHKKLGIDLGQDEIGFIALHIHSSLTNQHITDVKMHSELIVDLVQMIETRLAIQLERSSLDYARLLTHLRFAIERVRKGDKVSEPDKLAAILRQEYPSLYHLAMELTQMMEARLQKPVYQAETSYLTMHLHRVVPEGDLTEKS
ncbi:transcriptional antiterminator [Paenibacillus shirakamiensis]|uniref:Transcriptional antiterminator n=1 Tax=Paenibacillus shirakamiensis TaxID=1265935 RepID=A0ABS4JBG6_9BACL|nr:PRD domain-containing protein [Paenibacillus shirakamiensis]MBP1999053.1 transcriptional antiterminator [Paenibacillus shirakamiensis]